MQVQALRELLVPRLPFRVAPLSASTSRLGYLELMPTAARPIQADSPRPEAPRAGRRQAW